MKKINLLLFILTTLLSQNNESDAFSYSLKLYNEKFFDLSIREFSSFINKYPNSAQRPDALFYLGKSYEAHNEPDNAITSLKQIALDYPKHIKAAESWYLIGEIYERQKKFNESASAYETVKFLYSTSTLVSESLLKASINYEISGNFKKAEFTARSIIDQYPESPQFFEAKLRLVQILLSQNNIIQAQIEFDRIQRTIENEDQLDFQKSKLFIADQKLNDARALLEKLVNSKKVKTEDVKKSLGLIYFKQQNFSSSITLLNSIQNKDVFTLELIADSHFALNAFSKINYPKTNTFNTLFKSALAFQKQNKYDQSEQIFSQLNLTAINIHPKLIEKALLHRFSGLLKLNKLVKIVDLNDQFGKRISSSESKSELTSILTETYIKRQEYDLAIGTINRFIFSEPQFPQNDEHLLAKAQILEKKGNLSDAVQIYSKIKSEYPNSIHYEVVKQKLAALSSLKKIDQNQVFQQFTNLIVSMLEVEEKADHFNELARINSENLYNYKEAGFLYKKAASLYNSEKKHAAFLKSAQSFFKHSKISQSIADYTLAKDAFSELLKLNKEPNIHFEASKGLIETQLLLLSNSKEYNSKAITYYEKFVSVNDSLFNVDDIRIKLSSHYLTIKNPIKALSHLKEVTSEKYLEESLFQQALIYKSLDQTQASIDQFKTLLSTYPNTELKYKSLSNLVELEEKLGKLENSKSFLTMIHNNFSREMNDSEKSKLLIYFIENQKIDDAEKLIGIKQVNVITNDFILNKVLNLVPEEKILNLAKIEHARGNKSKAVSLYSTFLKYTSNTSKLSNVYITLGDLSLEQNNKKESIQFYQKVEKNSPHYLRAMQNSALLSYDLGLYDSVVRYTYEIEPTLTQENPAYSKLKLNKIVSEIKLGKSLSFETLLSQYKKDFPTDNDSHAQLIFERAKQLRQINKYTRSNKHLNTIIDEYESTSYYDDAYFYIILNNIAVNKFEEAFEGFAEFPEKFPFSSLLGEMNNALGNVYHRAGKFQEAVESYKEALKSKNEEDKKVAYSNMIDSYRKMGLWEAVLTTANTFIQLYPTDDKNFDRKMLIGQAYGNINRGAEGVAYLKQLKIQATAEVEPEIQFYIGEIYMKMKEYDLAVSEFIKIPLLSKRTKLQWVPSALYFAGQCYEKMGKQSEAKKMYTEIIQRPGIDSLFKKDAQKQIERLKAIN